MASTTSSFYRVTLSLLVAALCWLGAQALGSRALDERKTWPAAEDYALFVPPASSAPVIFAGYRQLAADIYWARALVYYGSSLVGEADFRYLEQFIDNVLALDPKFVRVYRWASFAVTYKHERATQEEFRIAIRYLERAIQEFPDTYEFFSIAGQRYFLDLWSDNPQERQRFRERGVELIEQAMRKKDAPKTLATFAATLRTRIGQKERALHDLREMILTTDNEEAQQKLIERYNQLSQTAFPDEAKRAKEVFEAGWKREVPFTSPSLYVILGDRPPPVIDFGKLATDRDLFGAEPEAFTELLPEETGSTFSPPPPEAQHLP